MGLAAVPGASREPGRGAPRRWHLFSQPSKKAKLEDCLRLLHRLYLTFASLDRPPPFQESARTRVATYTCSILALHKQPPATHAGRPVSGPRESLEVASRHCRKSLLVPQTSVLGDNFRPRGTRQKEYVNARVPGIQRRPLFTFCSVCFLFFPWTVLRLCFPEPMMREWPTPGPFAQRLPSPGAPAASRPAPLRQVAWQFLLLLL